MVTYTEYIKNVPRYRVIESKQSKEYRENPLNNENLLKVKVVNEKHKYLIGIKPINCNVRLDFGGKKVPIMDIETLCNIYMHFNVFYHNFDIWMEQIDGKEKEYGVELKYTDSINDVRHNKIIHVKTNNTLAFVTQHVEGMFGVHLIK